MSVLQESLQRLEFEFKFYDLYSRDVSDLRHALNQVSDVIDPQRLRGSLFAMTQALASNSLKAIYKQVFFKYLIQELGLTDLSNMQWLELFRTEIENHRAENFARVCREKGIAIRIRGYLKEDNFCIEVVNDGVPSEHELNRLKSSIEHARQMKSFSFLFQEEKDGHGNHGGSGDNGLGIPLILFSLRNLGLDADDFSIEAEGGKTKACITLPLVKFHNVRRRPIRILKREERTRELMSIVWHSYSKLGMQAVRFDEHGNVLAISDGLLERLDIAADNPELFFALLPPQFYSDIFQGFFGRRNKTEFKNYRIYVRNSAGDQEILFNISGYRTTKGAVNSLWQEVFLENNKDKLQQGGILENLKLKKMVEPYIPSMVLSKAREMIRQGRDSLPPEVRVSSIFFADLVGFTQKAEEMSREMVIELLNLALGVCGRSIEKHKGQIDKFMGDAVMGIFPQAKNAVIAAVEIQNNFNQLNEFRVLSGEEPILVRIGIHTGTVIMANIGTFQRMDWTAIGDVVNTASRIEKKTPPGEVFISQSSYDYVQDDIAVNDIKKVKVKGKQKEITVYSVRSVKFKHEGNIVELAINDEVD